MKELRGNGQKNAMILVRKKLDFLSLMDYISARSADIAELLGIKGTRAKKPLSELIAGSESL